jgi:predicted naringenin-chalcone synthase
MGCHGMINGLRVAASFVESIPDAVVLVGAVELCTLHQQYSEDPEQIVANSLFADGAAAAILTGRSQKQHTWEIQSSFSVQISNSHDLMTWKVGDHGFAMTLSSQVPLRIAEDLKKPLCHWLSQHGVSIEQIDHWVVHPGGPRILDGVIDSLQLHSDALAASRYILANHGNMSSPTVMFIFDEVLQRNASVSESQRCLMLGFGPGLHAEALLLVKPQQAPQ